MITFTRILRPPSLIPVVGAALLWLGLGKLAGESLPEQRPTSRTMIQLFDPDSSELDLARERLTSQLPPGVDIWHGDAPGEVLARYHQLIRLGSKGSAKYFDSLWQDHPEAAPDAFLLSSERLVLPTVIASGLDSRGTLFAAYRLADLLAAGRSLSTISVYQTPTVKRRYGVLTAASKGGAYYRNMLFAKDLADLPRYGLNGVVLLGYTSMNSPAGDDGPPFLIYGSHVLPIPLKLAEWHLLLHEIKRAGLDAILIIPPFFPGQYQSAQVVRHYSGESPIPDYPRTLSHFFAEYIETLWRELPELDGVFLLNWEYPGNIGAQMFTMQSRVDRYRYGPRDPTASKEALEVYTGILEAAAAKHKKAAGFIVHNAGLRWNEIKDVHEILDRHPHIIKIEPPYFTDNGWGDMPLFGFFPPTLPKDVELGKGSLFIFMTTTNGQYYGAGSLLSAYPDPFAAAADAASQRRAELVMMTLESWSTTSLGNLADLDEILPLAASARLWSPTPALSEIWNEWTTRRFGAAAAPAISDALRQSAIVVTEGFSLAGVDLLSHSAIRPYAWNPPSVQFALFGPVGSAVLPPSDNGYSQASNTVAYQTHARAIGIDLFRVRENHAIAAAIRSRKLIDGAKDKLSSPDYQYLTQVTVDTETLLRALLAIGEAAHATHELIASPNSAAQIGAMNTALSNLDLYSTQVRGFRNSPVDRGEKSSSGLIINPSLADALTTIGSQFRAYARLSPQERVTKLEKWQP